MIFAEYCYSSGESNLHQFIDGKVTPITVNSAIEAVEVMRCAVAQIGNTKLPVSFRTFDTGDAWDVCVVLAIAFEDAAFYFEQLEASKQIIEIPF